MVLAGPNGAGKTNLLEALSFLAPGHGLRRARLEDAAREDAEDGPPVRWAVAATLEGADGPTLVSTGLEHDPETGAGRRVVRIDGRAASSQSALARTLSVIWLTPELDRLFMEGASARRRFVDRLVGSIDAEHLGRVNVYARAMRERARLLRNERAGLGAADPAWLAALERRMAESGVALAAARRGFVRKLSRACGRGIGPFPAARATIACETGSWLEDAPALEAEERLRAALAVERGHERPPTGPHRADLEVAHMETMRPAARCSTGEQKALLIGIVLAHARLVALHRDSVPLLLLDEIAAHLDAERREALFDELCSSGAQAWMTGTDAALFRPLGDRAQRFRVENADVRRAGEPA